MFFILIAPIKASTKDNLVKKSTIDEIDNSLAKLHVFLSKYSKRQAAKKRLFSRSFPSVNKLKKLYDKIVLERQLLQRGRGAKRRTLLNDSRLSLLAKIGKLFSVLALKKWRPGKLGQAELSRRQQQGWYSGLGRSHDMNRPLPNKVSDSDTLILFNKPLFPLSPLSNKPPPSFRVKSTRNK